MTKNARGSTACAVVLGLGLSAAVVGSGLAGLLDDRQATMKTISLAFRPLGNLAKQRKFDAAAVAAGSQAIVAGLTRFKDLFPEGSEHADNSSSAAIWSDRAGFDKALGNAIAAANRLATAQDPLSLRDTTQAMADACSACHHGYRIDK
ncbi:MAG TPA: cytochrome c [Candidatus Cybelea sp.]|nr:cytochrome c [Candidatus Cybelea sp.]